MPNWEVHIPSIPHLAKVINADNPKAAMEIGIREQIARIRKDCSAQLSDLDKPLPEVIDHAYYYEDGPFGGCHSIRLERVRTFFREGDGGTKEVSEDTYRVTHKEPRDSDTDNLLPY